MKRFILKITMLACFAVLSCNSAKEPADLLIIHAKVYTVDANFNIVEAFAVKDGKILSTGTSQELLKKYAAKTVINMQGKPVYPGFIDAHCHFVGYAENFASRADLSSAESFAEMILLLKDFREKHPNATYIQGRGWNQEKWTDTKTPSLALLNQDFPDIPVFLIRVDGHAALVNTATIKMVNITGNQKIIGGEIVWDQGLALDNAMELFKPHIPKISVAELTEALKKAEQDCFQFGLTSVQDAGLDVFSIRLIDSLQSCGILKMNVYAMLDMSDPKAFDFMQNGIFETEKLNVRCVKMYADGALGSRGALLSQAYSDMPHHCGLQVTATEEIEKICRATYQNHYQMAIHCIGDAANHLILNIFASILPPENDLRWRIEHAQVVEKSDLSTFHKYHIVPSVQPTHATSDMFWVNERLGNERLENAYRYQSLLQTNGWMPLGTDFPVEQLDPKLTFWAAVSRKNTSGQPENGFFPEQALTRQETLRGMTIWAAKAAFEERRKGSIEAGKTADFVVFDLDLMTIPEEQILKARVCETWSKGEQVF